MFFLIVLDLNLDVNRQKHCLKVVLNCFVLDCFIYKKRSLLFIKHAILYLIHNVLSSIPPLFFFIYDHWGKP